MGRSVRIGLCYDLRDEYLALGYGEEETAEFDAAVTIDSIDEALRSLGFDTDRVGNIFSLVERLAGGGRWDLVFNITEGLRGIGREAQVPALLDAYGIPYTFSDPLVLSLCLHKGLTKRVVRDMGVPTPDFLVAERLSDLENHGLPYPLFAKPVAEGTGKGVDPSSKIGSETELFRVCGELLKRYAQPVLVETYLPGREFTVGILGTGADARSAGVMEIILLDGAEPEVYSYMNKELCESRVRYVLVDDESSRKAAETALRAYRGLGCRDAGRVDIRCDNDGRPCFIEINPLAGLNPHHSDLPILCAKKGMMFKELIGIIVDSALGRAAVNPGPLKKQHAPRGNR